MSSKRFRSNSEFAPLYGVEERLSPLIGRLLAHNPSPFTFLGTGVYLIGNRSGVAVVDPGPGHPDHLNMLRAAIGARKVTHILITHTHRDHSPAAAALKLNTGAKTYGYGPHARHDNDVDEGADFEFVPDIIVRDGDIIQGEGFRFECVHTPGHTSNHMCYALSEENALFVGDHIMGWSTTIVAPPEGDMGDYMMSLKKLLARDDSVFYPTHGWPIVKPKQLLRATRMHRRMRENQIATALCLKDSTPHALARDLYPKLAPALQDAARLTVEAHLRDMMKRGLVERLGNGSYSLCN